MKNESVDMAIDGQKPKSKKRFFGLWYVIDDIQSAAEAAKIGSYAAFYLTFSYLLLYAFYLFGVDIFGSDPIAPIDNTEKYLFLAIDLTFYLGPAGFAFWCGRRIWRGKYGLVPLVSIWIFIESIAKVFLAPRPGQGIVISIIFCLFAINALRGWSALRAHKNNDYESH